ncbi:MAG TPA: Gfo/Idh/MocA family oxidoreductase [Candidatus Hydrogenedentes bacterium]|nr:Gfo/Idh/MocA family oxidoreductase [Candidatus Hydrogenedentota bacterium]
MSQPFKIGLIGAGGISGQHLRAFKGFPERVLMTAVCDISEDAARKRAGEVGGAAVYADVAKMLREADIDAVDICTTHDQHAELALAAIAAGKHVLLEKPMGCSMQECRDMVAAAEKAGVAFMIAQCQRYMPTYRSVRRLVERGELGAIRAVRFDSMQDLPSFAPNGHWLCDAKKAGGGIVISVSVHRIDLMRYLIGDVKRVTGVSRSTTPLFTNGAENFAVGLLEFENGAIGEMFGTYTGFRMPWGEMFMIFADEGTIHAVPPQGHYEGDSVIALRRAAAPIAGWEDQYNGFAPLDVDRSEFPTDDGFTNEILHFADCCRTGKEPDSSGRDNLGTMATIFAFYESARTGQTVDVITI